MIPRGHTKIMKRTAFVPSEVLNLFLIEQRVVHDVRLRTHMMVMMVNLGSFFD
jgi:hypothetical protein